MRAGSRHSDASRREMSDSAIARGGSPCPPGCSCYRHSNRGVYARQATCPHCGREGPAPHIGSHARECCPNVTRLREVLTRREFVGLDDPTGCWLPGPNVAPGRRAKVGGQRAHITAYEAANGPVPDGCEVCHTCDVPPCANPAHTWAGTHEQNLQDMFAKGRGVIFGRPQ